MSKNLSAESRDEFTGLRGIFWPIHNFELKKFLPMGFLMMCILFNYNILRDTKDTLVVNAPAGGAESLSYLKLYGVTPSAILFMIIFVKLVNIFNKETLFYILGTFFIGFFAIFGFLIYPNKEMLHMTKEGIEAWQASAPSLHWFIPIIGNWSFSLFYIFSELWGSVFVSMLFWQFANSITKMNEAKRFYGLFGIIGNVGLVAAGSLIIGFSRYAKSVEITNPGSDTFGVNLMMLMAAVLVVGVLMMFTYRWIHVNVLTDPKLYDPSQIKQSKKKEKMGVIDSFKFIVSNKYLGLIAIIVLAYGVSMNLVEGVWKGQIKLVYPNMNDYNLFMGEFTTVTGFATIVLMLVGNNILRRYGWLVSALLTPILVMVTSAIFFLFVWNGATSDPFTPIMGTTIVMASILIGFAQNVMSKGTKYALFDSTKQMAYIPLDEESKTKGQGAVEVIGGRAGKAGGAFVTSTTLSVIGGGVSLSSLTHIFGPIVMLVCVFWLISVVSINKRMKAIEAGDMSAGQ